MEKLSGKVAEITRQEWQDLGFFYTLDKEQKSWHLTGDRVGLSNLAKAVLKFTDATIESSKDHEHLGPHWYLTISLDEKADINARGVWGTRVELESFAGIVQNGIDENLSGTIDIACTYVPTTDWHFYLHVKEVAFDPWTLDPQL